MFTNKMMIAAAAVSAVVVTAVDFAQSRMPEPSAAEQVEARFPRASEIMLPVNFVRTTPAIRQEQVPAPSAANCSREHWPYMGEECMVSTTPTKKPVRMITSERRYAELSVAPIAR
ncbi:MAG: hypothetical protein QOD74_105 [Variibacter sp.]|jgi:hypothetical protein|nr:hypothetical protein [Variibacter sp.]